MTWVYFEDSDRQVAAPSFSLERYGGGQVSSKVSLQDFYEQSLLVLLFPPYKPGAHEGLQRFADRLDEIERQGARVVGLLPVSEQEMSSPASPEDIPYPLLLDPDEQVREKYTGMMVADLVPEGSAILYLLDIYGAPWASYVGESLDEDGLVDEVLSWLVFIGVQCPE